MYIEIRKSGFVNKGDELILRTINFLVHRDLPGARVVINTRFFEGLYEQRLELGAYRKIWQHRFGLQWGRLARLVPGPVRRANGIVLDSQMDVVLDPSGFHYGDPFGPGPCREAAQSIRRWKKNGAVVVLMPQALGPFRNPGTRKHFKVVADLADLILARDKVSLENVSGLIDDPGKLRLSPDITLLMDGVKPVGFDPADGDFAVVPNVQMIDKTSQTEGDRYVPFLAACVRRLIGQGAKPFILIHGGEGDLRLGHELNAHFGGGLKLVREPDPVKIKGLIGSCDGLLGSRFHSAVNALSQGVPAFVIGWSHKYHMLMEDFGFPQGLISPADGEEAAAHKLDLHRRREDWARLKSELKASAGILRSRVQERWGEIVTLIGARTDRIGGKG